MKTVQSKDGTAIAFDQSGQGPALILVGGAFQHRATDPRTTQIAALLSAHFSVIHYDRRGRGDSGNTLPYATERELEDLESLVIEVGGTAFVFAMSSGGALALDAAARNPGISKLALYEPPFIVDASRTPLPNDYVERLERTLAVGGRGDAVAYAMSAAMGVPAEFVVGMRGEAFWADFEEVAHTLPYDGRLMGDTMSGKPLPVTRWSGVTVPTLVMDGATSEPYQRNAVAALTALLPNAQRSSFDGQSHDIAPELLAPTLTAFFTA